MRRIPLLFCGLATVLLFFLLLVPNPVNADTEVFYTGSRATYVGNTEVHLQIWANHDYDSSPPTRIEFYRGETLLRRYSKPRETPTANWTYVDRGLTKGTSYTYTVKAFVWNSNEDAWVSAGIKETQVELGRVKGWIDSNVTWSGGTWDLVDTVYLYPGASLTINQGAIVRNASGVDYREVIDPMNGARLTIDGATLQGVRIGDRYSNNEPETRSTVNIQNSVLDHVGLGEQARGLNITAFVNNTGECTVQDTNSPFPAFTFSSYSAGQTIQISGNNLPTCFAAAYMDISPRQLLIENNRLFKLAVQRQYYTGDDTLDAETIIRGNMLDSSAISTYSTDPLEIIQFEGPLVVENNTITGTMWIYGAYANYTPNRSATPKGIIQNNTIVIPDGYGDGGIRVTHAKNLLIKGNDVRCTGDVFRSSGIYLRADGGPDYPRHVTDNRIEDNVIRGCEAGLLLYQDSSETARLVDNVITGNTVIRNNISIRFGWSAQNNLIYNNRFRHITTGYESGNTDWWGGTCGEDGWDPCPNTWNIAKTPGENIVGGSFLGGNCYRGYPGVDADGDGLGDTPFVLDVNNVDYLPLMCAPGPDLFVPPFQLSADDVRFEGNRYLLAVNVTVENLGDEAAGPFTLRISDEQGNSTDVDLSGLAVDGTLTRQVDWDITPALLAGNGIAAPHFTATADPQRAIDDAVRRNNVATNRLSVDVRPTIEEIKPEYTISPGYFLDGPSLSNEFKMLVDWNGDAPDSALSTYGDVHLSLNGTQTDVDGQEWGAAHAYDMGADFESTYQCANNTLEIWATFPVQGGEITSLVTTVQPTVFPSPGWWDWITTLLSGGYFSLDAVPQAPLVEYQYDFKYPAVPFVATWTPPSFIPYLGGHELGVLQTQATVAATGKSSGTGTSAQSGATGFQVGKFGVMGAVSGSGQTQFMCGQSLEVTSSEFTLRVNALVETEKGLADLIPALSAVENWPLIGRAVKWLNSIAKVKGQLMPGVEIKTLYRTQGGELVFDQSEGTGFIGTKAIFEINPHPNLMADVYGGGEPYLTIWVPANPGYLKEVGIHLYYGADLRVFNFQQTFERKVTCSYPGGCRDGMAYLVYEMGKTEPTWIVIPRDYAGETYAVFQAEDAARRLDLQLASGDSATADQTLVSNIYPFPEPSLAVDGTGRRILAYVHDDMAKVHGRGTEIHALTFNGSAWSAPVPLTDDSQPDFSPAVAFDSNDTGLLLWQHSDLSPTITPTLDITFARSLDMSARTWDGVTWSAPVTLTNDSLMNYDPQLAPATDGTALALWKTNDGTDMLGTATHPVTLTQSVWNGSAWGAATPALTGLSDLLHVSVAARTSSQAAMVFSRDMDGDLADQSDNELFYSLYDGLTWSAPVAFTGDVVTDTLPALAYDPAGNLHVVWLRDGALVWLKNSWDVTAVQTIRSDSGEGGVLDFSFSRAPDGNLALVWQAATGGDNDLAYRVYDAAHDSWSADHLLTGDAAVESAHSPAFGADGTLYLAYQRTATQMITRTMTVSPSLTVTVTNLPSAGQSDLAFLAHTIGSDLTVDSLTLDPANPAPGQAVTLTTVLRNAGDLTVVSPQVSFFDGDTTISNSLILPDLASGYTATAQVAWTVPITMQTHTFAAVADPLAALAETDEANNRVEVTAVLPDLHVVNAWAMADGESTEFTMQVANIGVLDVVDDVLLGFRSGDPMTGTLAFTHTLGIRLVAGETVTVSHVVTDRTVLSAVAGPLWVVADDGDVLLEADETNNAELAGFRALPDLVVSAGDIQAGDGGLVIRVHNRGVVTATHVAVGIWRGDMTGNPDATETVATIGPGQSAEVRVAVSLGTATFFVKADPDSALAEIDEGNNLARREVAVMGRLYLPSVLR